MFEGEEKKKSNAGRKPVADKKETVSVFIHHSKIDEHGGMESLKQKIYSFVYNIPPTHEFNKSTDESNT